MKSSVLGVLALTLLSVPETVSADAWWGNGYKKPEWVLEHGGSIIKYRVKGEENSSKYKARLYLGNKVVETEYEGSGYFDDAINNQYKVIIYRGTKKEMSADVFAHPGETITLVFDLDKETVQQSSTSIPKSRITLNKRSAEFVKPSDLVDTKAATHSEDVAREEAEQARVEAEKNRAREERGKKIEALGSEFNTLEDGFKRKYEELGATSGFRFFLLGPSREQLSSLSNAVDEEYRKLEEMRGFIAQADGEDEKGVLEEEIRSREQKLDNQAKLLEQERKNESFWYRFKILFTR